MNSVDKIIVSRNRLHQALLFLAPAIAERPIIPILSNLLVVIEGASMSLTATDLATTLSTTLPVESSQDMRFCLPYKKVSMLVQAMAEQPLTLVVEPTLTRLLSNSGKYTLPGESAVDFPRPPVAPQLFATRQLDAGEWALLLDRLQRLVFCVAPGGASKEHLEGVCWWGQELAATDGFQLAVATGIPSNQPDPATVDTTGRLIPTAICQLISRSSRAAGEQPEVTIRISDSRIEVDFGSDYHLAGQLRVYRFPDYRFVDSITYPIRWQVDRVELMAALKRVLVMSDAYTNVVFEGKKDGSLYLSCDNGEMGHQGDETVAGDLDGDLRIGLNGSFLFDGLRNLSGPAVTLHLSQADRAVLMTGDDSLSVYTFPVKLNATQPTTTQAA